MPCLGFRSAYRIVDYPLIVVVRGLCCQSLSRRYGYGLTTERPTTSARAGSESMTARRITYLRGRQDVDSHRLGIWGPSYGDS